MPVNKTEPAIVAIGFNRPQSLRRLLGSLAHANYSRSNIPLIICVDHCDSPAGIETRSVANEFQWAHGEKRLIVQNKNLGLRNHILACGDLSAEYGSVIVLEDDLTTGPEFYQFAVAALEFTNNQDEIGGVSLYNHQTNFVCQLPFEPVCDGFDNYYLQIASSWGQAWTQDQWKNFRAWYDELSNRDNQPNSLEQIPPSAPIPEPVANWPRSSWLKYFIWYLAETDRLILYPRCSHSTNHADSGTHAVSSSNQWQVPLAFRCFDQRFGTPEESLAVYDSFFELHPEKLKQIAPEFSSYDFDVDFYGTKNSSMMTKPFVLTSQSASESDQEFELTRKPFVANLQQPAASTATSTFRLTQPKNINGKTELSLNRIQNVRYFYGPIDLRSIAKNLLHYFLQRRT